MGVRAKFKCTHISLYEGNRIVSLEAVHSDKEGENSDFTKYTPSGNLSIGVMNCAPAAEYFSPGEEYYLDFTAVSGEKDNASGCKAGAGEKTLDE